MADGRMVDLNADLGESFGAYTLGADAQVMQLITSANVACAMHAGDPRIMDDTVQLKSRRRYFDRRPPWLPGPGGIREASSRRDSTRR